MKIFSIHNMGMVLTALMLTLPLNGFSQTMRGDFNMDGAVGVSDVTALIDYLLADYVGGVSPADRDTITVGDVSFVMVRVEGGTFMRKRDECHSVSTFSIAQTEVTRVLWAAVMDTTLGYVNPGADCPMDYVSWNECETFISKLNEKTGLSFRMPTEYEWIFAATGGRLTRAYAYAGSDDLNEVAWYKENIPSGSIFMPVGSKAPNELGLYDMCGNAAEYCFPFDGNSGMTLHAAVHGGCSSDAAEFCTPLKVIYKDKDDKTGHVGLRVVL